MCFDISNKHPNAKIAKRDIICFKVLQVWGKELRSPTRHCLYRYDEIMPQRQLIPSPYYEYINCGYHSYSNKKKSDYRGWGNGTGGKILVQCIIPAGSTYYYNERDLQYIQLYYCN